MDKRIVTDRIMAYEAAADKLQRLNKKRRRADLSAWLIAAFLNCTPTRYDDVTDT